MKKIVALLVAVTLIFASCSKERKLNKQLDGTWNGVSFMDAGVTYTIAAPSSMSASFSKGKKDDGTYNLAISYGTLTQNASGSYTLSGDKSLVLSQTQPNVAGQVTWTIKNHSKTDLTLTDMWGNDYVFKKK